MFVVHNNLLGNTSVQLTARALTSLPLGGTQPASMHSENEEIYEIFESLRRCILQERNKYNHLRAFRISRHLVYYGVAPNDGDDSGEPILGEDHRRVVQCLNTTVDKVVHCFQNLYLQCARVLAERQEGRSFIYSDLESDAKTQVYLLRKQALRLLEVTDGINQQVGQLRATRQAVMSPKKW